MELLSTAGYNGKILATLNRCRLFLQAVTLSDITSGDGRRILEYYLQGFSAHTTTPYDWPYQGPLTPKYWKIWREAILTTFNVG
eukprot:4780208-Ditylum_brightwellii.AAC.1